MSEQMILIKSPTGSFVDSRQLKERLDALQTDLTGTPYLLLYEIPNLYLYQFIY